MASRTPRFKLSYFGAGIAGSIGDDGGKFTGLDRLTIDRLFSSLEGFDYRYRAPSAAVSTSAPTLSLGTNGSLQAATLYSYCVAFVDAAGLESTASTPASITTTMPLRQPYAPTTYSVEGGYLAARTWYYAITAVNDTATQESPLSAETSITLGGGFNTAVLTMPADADGTGLRVWRLGDDAVYWTLAGVSSAGATFTDTGMIPPDPCAGLDPASQPPAIARGSYVSSVTVTLDPADEDKRASAASWRVYRSADGLFGPQSLVATVTARTSDATPLLVDSYLDTGSAATIGQPASADQTLNLKPYTVDSVTGSLPLGSIYPENYLLVRDGALYVNTRRDSSWTWERVSGTSFTTADTDAPDTGVFREGDLHLNTDSGDLFSYQATVWTKIYSFAPAPAPSAGSGGGTGGTATSMILTSPNGSRYRVAVGDDGTLTTVATTEPGAPAAPTNANLGA